MDEAIAWRVRLRSATAAEWEDFTVWLGTDAAHRAAYEEVALLDEEIGGLAPPKPFAAAVDEAPPGQFTRRWTLAGAAAAAAAAMAAWLLVPAASDPFEIRTRPGEVRSITLAGGSEIHVNGGTRLVLDREDSRFARLVHGEALFEVTRDPANPFRVEAGQSLIRNIGTIFNVRNDAGSVAVEVAEGAVSFAAAGRELRLSAGEAVRVSDGEIQTLRRDTITIGGWRTGELSYSSTTVAEIAEDLTRNTGVTVTAEPSVAGRQFSGTIVIDQDRQQLRRRVAAVLDVDVRLAEGGWILAARGR